MVRIESPEDLTLENITAVAYRDEPLVLAPELLDKVEAGRALFEKVIAAGVPCYGVTTGLGQLVSIDLTAEEQADLPHNILRARAAAVGPPLPRPVVRALMMIKLANFLSGLDGVTAQLCQFLVDRLNDGFTPWVSSLGHGMAADGTANTHAFQTFIGEGFVLTDAGQRQPAADALAHRGVTPLQLNPKEGLALLNGIAAAPAVALDVILSLREVEGTATIAAAVTCEGAAAPKDALDPALVPLTGEPGTAAVIKRLGHLLAHSEIQPHKLQAAVSLRIIPQVHGALVDALDRLEIHVERAIHTFSDNPLLLPAAEPPGGRFLSVGTFHNQHLVNQADAVAVALAHVATLSTRRLHRLLQPTHTGLSHQLAGRPGVDAGLVVAHKAAVGICARIKQLAAPLSLWTEETSAGQEDYMSLALPTLDRLYQMVEWTRIVLAYELLGGITALRQREERPGVALRPFVGLIQEVVEPFERDRAPGPEVEKIIELLRSPAIMKIINGSQ